MCPAPIARKHASGVVLCRRDPESTKPLHRRTAAAAGPRGHDALLCLIALPAAIHMPRCHAVQNKRAGVRRKAACRPRRRPSCGTGRQCALCSWARMWRQIPTGEWQIPTVRVPKSGGSDHVCACRTADVGSDGGPCISWSPTLTMICAHGMPPTFAHAHRLPIILSIGAGQCEPFLPALAA